MTESIILTDAFVKTATVPDGKSEVYLREASGLALRVRSTGAKTFYFMHTRPGMKGTHKTFIGKYPKLKLAAARMLAANLDLQRRVGGIDLVAHKRAQKQAAFKPRTSQRWAI